MRKHGQPGSVRQLVPAAFVATAVGAAAALPWSVWPLAALGIAYAGYVLAASVAAARSARNCGLLPRLPGTIAAFHVGYGLGTWRGLWDIARSRAPSSDFARITR